MYPFYYEVCIRSKWTKITSPQKNKDRYSKQSVENNTHDSECDVQWSSDVFCTCYYGFESMYHRHAKERNSSKFRLTSARPNDREAFLLFKTDQTLSRTPVSSKEESVYANSFSKSKYPSPTITVLLITRVIWLMCSGVARISFMGGLKQFMGGSAPPKPPLATPLLMRVEVVLRRNIRYIVYIVNRCSSLSCSRAKSTAWTSISHD